MKATIVIFVMLISACSSAATIPAGPTRTIPDYLSHLATGTTYHSPIEIPAELIPPLVVTAPSTTVTLYGITYTRSANEPADNLAFVVAVREASEQYPYNWVDQTTDQDLIDMAHTICAEWNEELTYEQITSNLAAIVDKPELRFHYVGSLVDPWELVKAVVDAGTRTFCPAHTEKLP